MQDAALDHLKHKLKWAADEREKEGKHGMKIFRMITTVHSQGMAHLFEALKSATEDMSSAVDKTT